MTGSARDLARVVKHYLRGEIAFDEFESFFSGLFLDEIPEGALSAADLDRFGSINERLSWTSQCPTPEERDSGWIDRSQFRAWLEAAEAGAPDDSESDGVK